jgi:hypothetical protein
MPLASEPLLSLLTGEGWGGGADSPSSPHPTVPLIVFGTRFAKEASFSFPPGGGRLGWGEKLGRSAPLMRTPTPPSPVEEEGPAQRLTTKFVPNSIALPPPRGEGVLRCRAG